MICIGGTDKFVVGGIHQIPDGFDLACHIIDKFLRGYACCLCL